MFSTTLSIKLSQSSLVCRASFRANSINLSASSLESFVALEQPDPQPDFEREAAQVEKGFP